MNVRSNCYWNFLNPKERRELVQKVTGTKNTPVELVSAPVIPGIIESYLELHQEQIKPKYQVYVKNYKGAEWEEYERPVFFLEVAFNWADKQFKQFTADAVAVKDLLNERLMMIDY